MTNNTKEMKEILKEFRKFWLNKIKIHGSITSKDCEQFLSKAITKAEKRGREEVKKKWINVNCPYCDESWEQRSFN